MKNNWLLIIILFTSQVLSGQVNFSVAGELNDVEMDNSEYWKHYDYYTNRMAFNYSMPSYSLLAGIKKNGTIGVLPVSSDYFINGQFRQMGFSVGGDPNGNPGYESKIQSLNLGLKQQWTTPIFRKFSIGIFLQEMYRVKTKITNEYGLIKFGIYDWYDGLYMRKFDLSSGIVLGCKIKQRFQVNIQTGKSAWMIFKPIKAPYSKLFFATLQISYTLQNKKN